jgi:hypothetical protein
MGNIKTKPIHNFPPFIMERAISKHIRIGYINKKEGSGLKYYPINESICHFTKLNNTMHIPEKNQIRFYFDDKSLLVINKNLNTNKLEYKYTKENDTIDEGEVILNYKSMGFDTQFDSIMELK